jgi:CDP-4-dehydro-6-deoxyglucose reductase
MPLVTLSNRRTFAADTHVSVLDAALGHGITLEYSCRSGRCGVCKAAVLEGSTRALRDEESITDADRAAGRILTCCRAADTDLSLDIADLSRLAGVNLKTLPCRIAEITRGAPEVMFVTLRLPPGSSLPYLPGQYIDVIARGVRRSYSVANSPREDGLLHLHIRNYPGGVLSKYFFEEAKAGDLLRLQAPLGTFFFRDAAEGPLLFLATGTGIAPIKAMLEELAAAPDLRRNRPIHVYWGNRVSSDLYWEPHFPDAELTFVPVLSRPEDEWTGRRGYVQDAALSDFGSFETAECYACGSQDMIEAAETLLVQHGLNPRHFFRDAFVTSH